MLKGEWSLQESIMVLWAQLTRVESQDRAWTFLKAHFDEIRTGGTDGQNAGLIGGVVSRFCDEAKRSEATPLGSSSPECRPSTGRHSRSPTPSNGPMPASPR
jgi:hypothetical protein